MEGGEKEEPTEVVNAYGHLIDILFFLTIVPKEVCLAVT